MDVFLCVAPFLVADDDAFVSANGREAAGHGRVFGEAAVAMQFDEIAEGKLEVVERVRARCMPCDLHALPCSEIGINRLFGFLDFRLHTQHFGVEVHVVVATVLAQVFEFVFEFHDWFLEIEWLEFHAHSIVTGAPLGIKTAISLIAAAVSAILAPAGRCIVADGSSE